jgi:hypothetical protein
LTLFFLGSCSTRKDNFASRSYHNVTTKYNVLYNGNVALDKGILELNTDYEDNYWEVLPIEPLKISEEVIDIPGEKIENAPKTTFDTAEEKAVKAVQKHGMYIAGSERNKQIDDAYMLLGKARYYSQRFVPSLEAFEFTLKNNPNSDLNTELRIWKAKTLVRLQNEETAVDQLRLLLRKDNLTKEELEQAHTALAMAYVALDSIPAAIEQLHLALKSDVNNEQHARNLFVLGQLYDLQKSNDSAQWAFNQVIEYKKAPRKYEVHAYLKKVKYIDNAIDLSQLKAKIKKISKDPLNKPYEDEIHYHLAEISFKEENDTDALKYLHQSVGFPQAKKYQKVLSYERLGDYYFDKTDFVTAAVYYDSVRPHIENSNTKHIKKLERKIKNLEDVVFYENLVKENDSILGLVAMNETDRKAYFEAYIAKLKKADELKAIQIENAERNQTEGNQAIPEDKESTTPKGKWYFYNTQTVAFGKSEFVRLWGKRELKDNWRWSQNKSELVGNEKSANNSGNNLTKAETQLPEYNVNTYLKKIPSELKEIEVLKDDKANALYQLGLIYKEKFQVYPLAANRLERFLESNAKENLVLPAKYHLSKVYEKMNDSRSVELKNQILSQFPESRYAQMLQNTKENIVNDSIKTPEMHYEKVYCDYEYEYFDLVLSQCEEAVIQYADDPILPKFELLKAYALYHVKGKDSFIDGLEFVVANFPKTEEAIHAQEVLDRLNGIVRPKEESKELKVREEPVNNPKKGFNKTDEPLQNKEEEEKRQKVMEMIKKQGPPAENEKKG